MLSCSCDRLGALVTVADRDNCRITAAYVTLSVGGPISFVCLYIEDFLPTMKTVDFTSVILKRVPQLFLLLLFCTCSGLLLSISSVSLALISELMMRIILGLYTSVDCKIFYVLR